MSKFIKSIPNCLTMLNMLLGLASIIILMRTKFDGKEIVALGFILLGGFVDLFDGYLARKLNAVTDIGKQLDSFADLVTFGIAPICLLHYLVAFDNLLPIVATFMFPACGAFRLARYNLNDFSGHFMGLPITAAGIILALYAVSYTKWSEHQHSGVCTAITLVVVAALSVVMVSKIKVNRVLAVKEKE